MPPITPAEAKAAKKVQIPKEVFDAFNTCITKYLSDGVSEFTQKEVISVILSLGLNREDIFTNKWLEVEDLYREVGWKVVYDRPGFNESYDATFCFTERPTRKRR